jgi:photosystem II stability/assembly factor-like uncharacterized protein
MTDPKHEDHDLLERWSRLSSRSQPPPVVRGGVRARRPAPSILGFAALIAMVVIATALVALRPSAEPGASPVAVGPSSIASASATPSDAPSLAPMSPTAPVAFTGATSVSDGGRFGANEAWALADDKLVVTHDGGRSWWMTTKPGGNERVMGAAFADPQRGWLATETYPEQGQSGELMVHLHRTDDGGTTWESIELARVDSPGPDPTVGFPYFSILSRDELFVLLSLPTAPGYKSRLYASTDGGRTWDRRTGVTEGTRFRFMDSEQGWAIRGDQETLLVTFDGGRTWAQPRLPTLDGAIRGVYPTLPERSPDGLLVMALVRGDSHDRGAILTSQDDGRSWKPLRRTDPGRQGSISFAADGTWLLSGSNPGRSKDRGATWESIAKSPGNVDRSDGTHLLALAAVAPPNCGDCFVPTELWFSDDAGQTWRDATP